MNKLCLGLLLVLHSASTQGCDPRCKGGQGTCQTSGRCLCWWGWTGPHATYITSGAYKNRILADYCTTACHYTHDYRNPRCARIPPPTVCSVPHNKTVPPLPCDPGCGTGIFHSTGKCLSNGRCLCWWGWTGPHACYITGGVYNNRILADKCSTPCHYTHVYRNLNCTRGGPTTLPPSAQPHHNRGRPTSSSGSKASKSHSSSQQSSTNEQQLYKPVSTLAAISFPRSTQLQPTGKGTAQQHVTSGKPIPGTDTKPSVAQPPTTPAVTNTSSAKPLSTTQKATGVQTKHCSTQKSTRTETPTPQQTTTVAIQTTTSTATQTEPTEPPEPSEPTEPTEPTEPVMAMKGMPQNIQSKLQADEDGINENDSDSDPPKKNSTAAVILVVTLLVGVFVIGGVVWWKHGSGNQCSRLLGGYEPVENNEINTETKEFSLSSVFP